ncbi:unnamed protein product [Ilex paraguariensis]|uniref:Alpha/beta hydrolase fold-3 domain-containing protein n=1 Tax=Ilex paraguariensis TaxID=185542 RepID=A0ABC8S0M0_9AQUA
MASSSSTTVNEIAHEFLPSLRVYKDGRVERYVGTEVAPASVDPTAGVQSKDIKIVPDIEANIIVVSVNYRLAPEHLLPVAYEDSWVAVKWVASHFKGDGQEPWLKDYVDFDRVFFGGDSAGGNIAHNMAMRVGLGKLDAIRLVGLLLNHPFIWGEEPIGNEAVDINYKARVDSFLRFVNPTSVGSDDPLMNPGVDPKLSSLGCTRVLICVAEKDPLRDRGLYYCEVLAKSGWKGKVENMEAKGEDHVFHLINPLVKMQ